MRLFREHVDNRIDAQGEELRENIDAQSEQLRERIGAQGKETGEQIGQVARADGEAGGPAGGLARGGHRQAGGVKDLGLGLGHFHVCRDPVTANTWFTGPTPLGARCVFPFGARRQCTASDGSRTSMDAASRSIVAWSTSSATSWSGTGGSLQELSEAHEQRQADGSALRRPDPCHRAGSRTRSLLFPFLVARQVRTTSLPSTRRLMASMISFVESLGVGLVDLVSSRSRESMVA